MNTFESFDENEVMQFFHDQKPDIFQFFKRKDPVTFRTVFVLKWK